MKYTFTSIKVALELQITKDGKVSGKLGNAHLENLILKKNKGNPKYTGISYIIVCNKPGKLSPEDPEPTKSLELWLEPMTNADKLNAELRLGDSSDRFPMGKFILTKQK